MAATPGKKSVKKKTVKSKSKTSKLGHDPLSWIDENDAEKIKIQNQQKQEIGVEPAVIESDDTSIEVNEEDSTLDGPNGDPDYSFWSTYFEIKIILDNIDITASSAAEIVVWLPLNRN